MKPFEIQNTTHKATQTNKTVMLENKSIGQRIEIMFYDKAEADRFIDIIFNRD